MSSLCCEALCHVLRLLRCWRKTNTTQKAALLTLRWRHTERTYAPLDLRSDNPSSFRSLHKLEQTSSWTSRTKTRCITAIWPPEVDRSFVSGVRSRHNVCSHTAAHTAVCWKRRLFSFTVKFEPNPYNNANTVIIVVDLDKKYAILMCACAVAATLPHLASTH